MPGLVVPTGHRVVSVMTARTSMDVTLPCGATCGELVPELLRMLPDGPERRSLQSPEPGKVWWLFQVGGRPLPAGRPIAETVSDGESLYLVPDAHLFVAPEVCDGGGLWHDETNDSHRTDFDPALALVVLTGAAFLATGVVLVRALAYGTLQWRTALSLAAASAAVALASTLQDRRAGRAGWLGTTVATIGLPLWVTAGVAAAPWRAGSLLPGFGLATVGLAVGLLVGLASARSSGRRAVLLAALFAGGPAALIALGGAAVAEGTSMRVSTSALVTAIAAALAVVDTVLLAAAPSLAVRMAGWLGGRATGISHTAARETRIERALSAILVGAGTGLAGAWAGLALCHGVAQVLLPVTVAVVLLQCSGFRFRVHRLVMSTLGAVGVAAVAFFWLHRQPAFTAVITLLALAVTLSGCAAMGGPGRSGRTARHPLLSSMSKLVERLLLIACVPLLAASVGLFDLVATLGGRWR